MARKKTEDTPKPETAEDSLIVSAAKAIGTAAGKIASLAGATVEAPKPKRPKLAPKNKSRLPRKQKKHQQKLKAAQEA